MPEIERIGDYEIDRRRFELRWRGRVVPVERRVFDLISYLVEHHDRVVPKEELFDTVWQGRVVSAGSLTVAVAAARRALRDDPRNPRFIITHHGRGYRFRVDDSVTRSHEPLTLSGRGLADAFVGRADELRLLEELLKGASSGRAQLGVILGEPGIGKSRLLDEFARVAVTHAAQAVVGRCREEEGSPPFWPWVQIVRQLCQDDRNQRASIQLASEAPEIARSVPWLRDLAQPVADGLPPANARFRLFDGIARFISCASRDHVLAVLLDDVHRADIDSLLLLEFLVDSLRSDRLLFVVTHRAGDLLRSQARAESLARSIRQISASSLQLRGLSVDDIAQLVRTLGGLSPTIEQSKTLAELTGGNPFFLSQIASILFRENVEIEAIAQQMPPTVRDAVAQHMKGLSSPALKALRVAAVVGRQFELGILARVRDSTTLAELRILREAIDAGVVVPVRAERNSYRFVHALVRDVLYQSLETGERARLHGAIGEALEQVAVGRTRSSAEVAHHYAEAAIRGCVERAIRACKAAADEAREAVAYGEAVSHHQRALGIVETLEPEASRELCSILLALGSDQVRTGDRVSAKQSFDRAARIAEVIDAPAMVAEAALGIAPGFFAVESGVHDELLISLLRRSQARLGHDLLSLRALVLARLGMALFWSDVDGECARLSREAWEIASAKDQVDLRLRVLVARWLAEWTPYELAPRVAIAEEAIALARARGDREVLAVALLLGLVGALECGRIDLFDELAREFRGLADELRQPQAVWYSKLIASARDLHAGRFVRAEEGAVEYLRIGRRIGDANASLSWMAQGLLLASERGDPRAILAISEEAHAKYPVFFGWKASKCWALARLGEIDRADAAVKELCSTEIGSVPRKLDWPTSMVLLAETAFLLGSKSLAEELHALLLPMRGRLLVLGFCVMTWGPVSRYLGLLCETLGRPDEAEAWYEQAVEEARRSGGEPWGAHAAHGLVRVRQRLGSRRGSCKEIARAALATARRLGMRHLEAQLTAAGASQLERE